MTNKIASEVLKASSIQQMGFCKVIVDGKSFSVKEALDIAIKALEQEPCEDTISRQAIIDMLNYGILEDNIKKLPSVTPKEKTGKWIRWYETIEQEHCTIHDPHCKCSECNQEYDPYIASLFNYCPNCGAKMQEVEE